MKNKPTKMPKARVRPAYYLTHPHNRNVPGVGMPCELVLPCSSRKEANQRKKWANMSGEAKVEAVARALYMDDTGPVKGRAARFEECLREQGVELYLLERKAKCILALMGAPTP